MESIPYSMETFEKQISFFKSLVDNFKSVNEFFDVLKRKKLIKSFIFNLFVVFVKKENDYSIVIDDLIYYIYSTKWSNFLHNLLKKLKKYINKNYSISDKKGIFYKLLDIFIYNRNYFKDVFSFKNDSEFRNSLEWINLDIKISLITNLLWELEDKYILAVFSQEINRIVNYIRKNLDNYNIDFNVYWNFFSKEYIFWIEIDILSLLKDIFLPFVSEKWRKEIEFLYKNFSSVIDWLYKRLLKDNIKDRAIIYSDTYFDEDNNYQFLLKKLEKEYNLDFGKTSEDKKLFWEEFIANISILQFLFFSLIAEREKINLNDVDFILNDQNSTKFSLSYDFVNFNYDSIIWEDLLTKNKIKLKDFLSEKSFFFLFFNKFCDNFLRYIYSSKENWEVYKKIFVYLYTSFLFLLWFVLKWVNLLETLDYYFEIIEDFDDNIDEILELEKEIWKLIAEYKIIIDILPFIFLNSKNFPSIKDVYEILNSKLKINKDILNFFEFISLNEISDFIEIELNELVNELFSWEQLTIFDYKEIFSWLLDLVFEIKDKYVFDNWKISREE